jgi:hypothetical protein
LQQPAEPHDTELTPVALVQGSQPRPPDRGAPDAVLLADPMRKMVEQLVIEESKHEVVEEMYFWPAVSEKLPDGDKLADTAIGQEQEGKKVLDKLDKLDVSDAGFEQMVSKFIEGRPHAHQLRGDQGLAVAAECLVCRGGQRDRHQDRAGQENGPEPPAPAQAAVTRGIEGTALMHSSMR